MKIYLLSFLCLIGMRSIQAQENSGEALVHGGNVQNQKKQDVGLYSHKSNTEESKGGSKGVIEKTRKDSLIKVWEQKSEAFFLAIDSIGDFNKYNQAIYKTYNKYGVIDDLGNVLVEANTYDYVLENDGYVLLMDKKEQPTRLFCYNAKIGKGYQLPSVTRLSPLSSHYGKVMLPRTNGLLVAYPNNTHNVFVYDLNTQKRQTFSGKEAYLKTLKKNNIIKRYNKNLEVKINKKWYELGEGLGGGFHPLFYNKILYGFFNTYIGKVYSSSYYSYFGAFSKGRFQIVENGKQLWMDIDGLKFQEYASESGTYTGKSTFVKVAHGKYKILQEIEGNTVLVKGDKQLPALEVFLKRSSN